MIVVGDGDHDVELHLVPFCRHVFMRKSYFTIIVHPLRIARPLSVTVFGALRIDGSLSVRAIYMGSVVAEGVTGTVTVHIAKTTPPG